MTSNFTTSKAKRMKKIAYVSGTRADFGLMSAVLDAINKRFDLQIFATGIHLMPEFGFTFKEVKAKFPDAVKINSKFKSDGHEGMARFLGDFSSKLAEIFIKNRPDFVLTLGDRPEMLCTAKVCLYLGIPTGHFHGGDRSSTVDEVSRHAITKLSHVHFPATAEAAKRIERMGEEKDRIHIVGAPALDIILQEKLLSREDLFEELDLDPGERVILLTQHPVSEEISNAGHHMDEIISAIKKFNLPVVVIYPHADAGGRKIIKSIEKEKNNPFFRIFPSLPHKIFLALEREAAVWVGNSSGAMVESASFGTPVVNVGNRQLGRQRGANVLDVGYDKNQIGAAINKSLNDKAYLKRIKKIRNPWGDGKTATRVIKILDKIEINSRLLNKRISY